MIQRFLVRFVRPRWLIPAGLGFAVFGLVEETAWWALTLAGTFLLPLSLATWVQDRDRNLEEQRKKKYDTPEPEHHQ